jgi:hypothetical protein
LLDDKKIPLFSNSRQIIVGSSTAPQMFQHQQSKTGVEHQNYMTKCIRNEHIHNSIVFSVIQIPVLFPSVNIFNCLNEFLNLKTDE